MPRSANGEQLFVVVDIHGQPGAMRATLSAFAEIALAPNRGRLVLLSDIIDRGPASLEAIDLVENAKAVALVDDVVILPCNHELMVLDTLEDPMIVHGRLDRQWRGRTYPRNSSKLHGSLTRRLRTAGNLHAIFEADAK